MRNEQAADITRRANQIARGVTPTVTPEDMHRDAMTAPTDAAVISVSDLAHSLLDRQAEVTQAELMLKDRKEALRLIVETLLPDAMREHGIRDLTMSDGSTITIQSVIRASITAANREKAFDWLDDNGHGDLIKHVITTRLGRGERDTADQIMDLIEDLGVDADYKPSVHPGTLSAFVREQTAKGVAVPDDLLGVYRAEVATVKPPA
jgi:hypothetical protein